jgi:mRNA-degrading endonuclease RelE of RelBE toxin-antitoxin system
LEGRKEKVNKPCEVQFVNEKVQKTYEELEEKPLKDQLEKALGDIEENPFCGIQIPKRLIPKDYIKKHGISNVWKYNLPGAWRLIYSIRGGEAIIITIILDWMDHKTYEKKFKY